MPNSDSEQIKRQIDATRSQMDQTLEQIEQRLRPGNLINETLTFFQRTGAVDAHSESEDLSGKILETADAVGESFTELGKQVISTVKENPVGSLLVTTGLAYIAYAKASRDDRKIGERQMAEPLQSSRDSVDDRPIAPARRTGNEAIALEPEHSRFVPSYYEEPDMSRTHDINRQLIDDEPGQAGESSSAIDSSLPNRGGQPTAETQSTDNSTLLESTSESVREAARATYLRSRATARDAKTMIAEAASAPSEFGASTARKGSEKFNEARNEYPLAVGLGFAALGALAGLMIPRTRKEDRWMGQQSDAVKQHLRDSATVASEQVASQGRQAISEVGSTALRSMNERGLDKQSLIARAKHVVNAAMSGKSDSLATLARQEGLSADQLLGQAKEVLAEAGATASHFVSDAESQVAEQTQKAMGKVASMTENVSAEVEAKASELTKTASGHIETARQHVDKARGVADDIEDAAKRGAEVVASSQQALDRGRAATANPEIDGQQSSTDADALEISQKWSDHEKSAS